MAIVQVSRITNRKGLTENLPQLAGAELGWCVDSRRLFIGNGTLEEGAPIIGNTEILTEFSDVIALSPYTYKDTAVGYAAQTGPTPSDPVVRTVQQKLDDFADVRDFGAVGDGVADDTAAINRALYELYCRETNTQIRRSLFFPAGTYRITETIIIPTYAKLMGEGADCTIIYLDDSVDISSLTEYVARFGDSLQQTGTSIGNSGATPPQNIEISSMSFQTGPETDVFLVEDATECYFDSVNFVGPLTSSSIVQYVNFGPSLPDIAGVRFASTPVLITNMITFDKCRFTGLSYGISTDEQINSVTVSNGKFDTLYQGVVLGAGTPVNGGPTGFRAVGNMFDNVFAEGIIYDDISLNASAHNVFYDVANEFQGVGSPSYSIIVFGQDDNVSIADLFERPDANSQTYPRIKLTGGTSSTSSFLRLGRWSRGTGKTFTLANNQSVPASIFTIGPNDALALNINYTVIRGTAVRSGVFSVVNQNGAGSLVYMDDYNENTSSGIVLSAVQSGSDIVVKYTSTNTGTAGTLLFSSNLLS